MNDLKKYNVALSFAGEDREIARNIYSELVALDLTVFFDEDQNLLGEDLLTYLADIYGSNSDSVLMLISKSYVEKTWTRYERRHAFTTAIKKKDSPYILPIRLDDSEVQELPDSVVFLSIPPETASTIAKAVSDKLRGSINNVSNSKDGGIPSNVRRNLLIGSLIAASLPVVYRLKRIFSIDSNSEDIDKINAEITHRLRDINLSINQSREASTIVAKANLISPFFEIPDATWPKNLHPEFEGQSLLTIANSLKPLLAESQRQPLVDAIDLLNEIAKKGKSDYYVHSLYKKDNEYLSNVSDDAEYYLSRLLELQKVWSGV